jgi:peptide-methionine (S)-S-oxide reductase
MLRAMKICLRAFLAGLPPRALPRVLALAALVFPFPAMSADTNPPAPSKTEFATLGGGCFWCLEAMFKTLPGVKAVTSGYAGGKTGNPTYKQVCEGDTGHAEVVRIEFDPAQISYEKILDAFWDAHDPTTLNRQGNDVGTQYRSIILYASEAQRAAAEKSKAAAAKRVDAPIVTEVIPLTKFYAAEGYHQDYFQNNPRQPYCVMVVRPKLKHFEEAQKARKTAP